jgi:hypothetical protein
MRRGSHRPFPWRETYDVWLTPLVVQFSDSRRTAAPGRPQVPDQRFEPDLS